MAFGGADAKQSLECRHRRLPSVEAKNELVQVGLQIFWRNAVVGSQEPGFQVRKDPVDVRRHTARALGRVLDFDAMSIIQQGCVRITPPPVGMDL